MKKTARILTVVFTVVSLFGSTLTAQAATVKSNKKVKYYKTAGTKKKAGTFKKATKLNAKSMSKGFVKFKKGKKTYYIKITDVKVTGKFKAKVIKKTKAYNKKLKVTKTVLKKKKNLTISGMKVKKKVAYLKYGSGKFVKATDVKVTSFKTPGPGPIVTPTIPVVASQTPTPTPVPTPVVTPIPDEFLGPNLVPKDKSTFDYWANGAHQGESLSTSDHRGKDSNTELEYGISDGYGVISPEDPIPNNYTYNLKHDTGALYGHWNFTTGYGADLANDIQGLTKGITYQITFDYFCPFDNDVRLASLTSGEPAVDENGEYILDENGKRTLKNWLPNGQPMDLIATNEWQTYAITVKFSGQIMFSFGMWNPAAETTTGIFIDNFTIKAVLDSVPTAAPPATAAPTEVVDGVVTYDKVFSPTDYRIAQDQAYGGAFTWSATDYALAITAGYTHVLFNGSLYTSTFPSPGTYRVVINGMFSPSSITQTNAMSYSTTARREKVEADGLGDGETVGQDGKVYKDGQVVYLNGNSVKDHESYSEVKPITQNTEEVFSNHVFDIEVKEGANEFMMHLIPGYSGETNLIRSMQIYKLN